MRAVTHHNYAHVQYKRPTILIHMVASKNPHESPDQILIDAARHYAARVTGQPVRRITLLLDDGSKRKIDVPARASSAWPPAEGWALQGDQAAYGGRIFRLAGKPLAVFATLLEVGTEGIALSLLKSQVWDEHTGDRTVQNVVSKLRQLIRDGLGLPDDCETVSVEGDRYWLREVEKRSDHESGLVS